MSLHASATCCFSRARSQGPGYKTSPFEYDKEKKAFGTQNINSKLHPHAAVAFILPPVEWVSPSYPPNLSHRPFSAYRPSFG